MVDLKTPEVMTTGKDKSYILPSPPAHLQEPGHHRLGSGRRAGRFERRGRPRRRYPRLGCAHRQAGLDLSLRASPGRGGARHLGRRQLERSFRRKCMGLHDRRRRARHSLHALRRSQQRPRGRRSSRATTSSTHLWSRSTRTPASCCGTSRWFTMISGTLTWKRHRHCST